MWLENMYSKNAVHDITSFTLAFEIYTHWFI